jgi:hypothetical protein
MVDLPWLRDNLEIRKRNEDANRQEIGFLAKTQRSLRSEAIIGVAFFVLWAAHSISLGVGLAERQIHAWVENPPYKLSSVLGGWARDRFSLVT